MAIINLTQHVASQDQREAGVQDLNPEQKQLCQELLTFDDLPEKEDIENRATALAELAKSQGANSAMIGGAAWLMPSLAEALKQCGIKPMMAFSKRCSEEHLDDEGNVVKVNTFKHIGFIEV